MQLQVFKKKAKTTEKKEEKSTKAGIWALIIKLGAKFLPFLVKSFKLLKVGKVALIGASIGAYAFLFSWQFAVMLVAMIFVHEYGHVWAMKRKGMKVRGMYFIPFLGAVAVGDEEFPTRKTEFYTAIMGPAWGLGFSAIIGAIYFPTHNPVFAAGAAWLALVNLFNLLPINPLDGGRIVKSIAFSLGSKVGIAVFLAGFGLATFLVVSLHLWLLVILVPIGALEILLERQSKNKKPKLAGKQIALTSGCYVVVIAALVALMNIMGSEPGAAAAMSILQG